MSLFFSALWVWERVPRMHRSDGLKSENESLPIISMFCFFTNGLTGNSVRHFAYCTIEQYQREKAALENLFSKISDYNRYTKFTLSLK